MAIVLEAAFSGAAVDILFLRIMRFCHWKFKFMLHYLNYTYIIIFVEMWSHSKHRKGK